MKKVLTIVLVIAMLVAVAIPAMANTSKITWTDGFGFHCNNGNGNPKVVTGFEKAIIGLTRVGNSTVWDLDIILGNACPRCERIDWITYSNNNGKINGKNIQVNHSDNPVYVATASAELVLIETTYDCEGELVSSVVVDGGYTKSGTFATNAPAIFDFEIPTGYTVIRGSNPVVINFAAERGQNISREVVAEKVIILECECEDDEEDDDWDFLRGPCGSIAICDNCQNAAPHAASHAECWDSSRATDLNYNKNTNYFCNVEGCPCNGNAKVGGFKFDVRTITCSCGC